MKYTVSGKKILAKKYKSWDEFEKAVVSLKEPKPKGDAFEDFFYIYLNLKKRKFQVKGNEIYRRNELPKEWQKKLKLKNRYADKGTDFFWQKTDGKIWACQVKFRSVTETLTISDLATFITDSYHCKERRLVFFNQLNIPDEIKPLTQTLLRDELESLDEKFFARVHHFFQKKKILLKKQILLKKKSLKKQILKKLVLKQNLKKKNQ